MADTEIGNNRLDRPVRPGYDHVLGPDDAAITLVEYGSYACPHCRAANERIAQVRDRFGNRLRYAFRHRPLTGSDIARRAAELAEHAHDSNQFWEAHVALMTRSPTLTEDDLRAVAEELGLARETQEARAEDDRRAKARVEEDERSARASGVMFTPTFFINGRRYDGPWDERSFEDAMLGSLGHRVRVAALDFAAWAPSTGLMLLLTTVIALLLTNSMWGAGFQAFWQRDWGLVFGDSRFLLSLLHWINDGLLTVFFLVVGLEIKRELTVGHLASRRSAALPIAAALGGMIAPALAYSAIVPAGPWSHGWGVPMATDTAFAVALVAMMGRRVPVELRIFLTAAAIVDDIGSIVVVAFFYSGALHFLYLGAGAVLIGVLSLLNRSRVYRVTPYLLVGVALWFCIHEGGLHATLAGVVLAMFIPTRPPPNLRSLMVQANSLIEAEAEHGGEVLRHGPSLPALRALDAIHDRLESPADRTLRQVAPRSSYVVLPLFALANAGVALSAGVWAAHESLMFAVMCGLVVGKPLGFVLACALAVRLGWAVKPNEYSWRQLVGAGMLAGIGFTMSLFIASQAFPAPADFAAAKIAVFAASVVSAAIGVGVLWNACEPARMEDRMRTRSIVHGNASMAQAGNSRFELIMRPGVHPERVVGKKVPPPPVYSETRENGLLIEHNVSVRLRDGVRIYVDIYRPAGAVGEQPLPALLGWSPYGKHNVSDRLPWPAADVRAGWMSAYTAFEAPDPMYWCPRGYAIVYPDPRGAWYSEGELRHGGMGEAEDCFDLIQWLGAQRWSNGKVGMTGVSYLSAIQWQVAPLRPPHLAAINPFEGFSDWYREFAYHGGIPETSFLVRGTGNLQWSTTRTEDTLANARAHPLYDAYWASKECDLEAIEVPAYVVASWSDQGLHTRGTLEAYKRMRSTQKWLEVHGRKKWHYYYEPSNVERQRAFFDHFLKTPGTRVPAWPKVLIEVRERANVGEMRAEKEWPLARTQYRKLYLDASKAALSDAPAVAASEVRYDPQSAEGCATFDHTFGQDTELTGHMKLRLTVEAIGADDMDLFVAIQKLDERGAYVPFVFYAMLENGPVALGWLRVSHRELDPLRSTPEQPFHTHVREQFLKPGERVPVEIEIWPSSTLFRAGERLRVVVQGQDVQREGLPNAPFARHENTRNRGTHLIHTGGTSDSHLLIPVIPQP